MTDINSASSSTAPRVRGRVNWWGVLLGLLIATIIPLVHLVVASLWANGFVTLEPNGPFVQTIEATGPIGLFLVPIGLVVLGLAARLRGLRWVALFAVGLPALAILWFVGVAYLDGLAGEPF